MAIAAAAVGGALAPVTLALWPAALLAGWSAIRRRSWWWVLAALAAGLAASALAAASWRAFDQVATGPWTGRATVIGDPRPVASFDGDPRAEIVLEIDGSRYVAWLDGPPAAAATSLRAGDGVWLDGGRMYPAWGTAQRLARRHIVGEVRVHDLRRIDDGTPLARAVNRTRTLFESGTGHVPEPERQVVRALLYGDDRFLAPDDVDAMRAAGLAHLTAVSGQQVALVLVVIRPVRRRLRPGGQWTLSVLVIVWFAALTRFEPSVVRASWMAALGVTAATTGTERRPVRLLSIAVTAMVLIDPMVVHAAGWWMSVAATGGLVVLSPRVEAVLPGPGWLRRPLAVTLAAQAAVGPVVWLVFGVPPVVGIPANLLAVPAAAFVTLVGLPLAVLTGVLPGPWAPLWLPVRAAAAWILAVARTGDRLEPGPPWSAVGWALLGAALLIRAAVLVGRYVRVRTAPAAQRPASASSSASRSTGSVRYES